MVCKLPLAEVGEFQLSRNELRRLEWSQLEELPARQPVEPQQAEPAFVERFVPVLSWQLSELASQAATQLSNAERRLLCSLTVSTGDPDPLGSALAVVFTQRLRAGLRLSRSSRGRLR